MFIRVRFDGGIDGAINIDSISYAHSHGPNCTRVSFNTDSAVIVQYPLEEFLKLVAEAKKRDPQ